MVKTVEGRYLVRSQFCGLHGCEITAPRTPAPASPRASAARSKRTSACLLALLLSLIRCLGQGRACNGLLSWRALRRLELLRSRLRYLGRGLLAFLRDHWLLLFELVRGGRRPTVASGSVPAQGHWSRSGEQFALSTSGFPPMAAWSTRCDGLSRPKLQKGWIVKRLKRRGITLAPELERSPLTTPQVAVLMVLHPRSPPCPFRRR